MPADPSTPDAILAAAELSILPGAGYRTLRIEVSRNLLGGQSLLRLESVDPIAPRHKPVNLLRQAGIADVLMADAGQSAADLLRVIAESLDRAAAT